MEKSSYTIRIEFDEAVSQANNLEKIAKDLNKAANLVLENALSGIKSSWNSDSSFEYLKKGRKVQEELRERAKDLTKIASDVRTVARNTYDAEKRAAQIAMTRNN